MIDQLHLKSPFHIPFHESTVTLVDQLVGSDPPLMEELREELRRQSGAAGPLERSFLALTAQEAGQNDQGPMTRAK